MNVRALNILLLAICLGLAGTLGFTLYLFRDQPRSAVLEGREIISNTITQKQIAIRKVGTADLMATLANYRPLTWADIESTNYVLYVLKLQAIGCPDETIRDIILTDVAKLYARKRAELVRGQVYEYWTREGWAGGGDPAVREQLRLLDEEQTRFVAELLGVDFKTELARYWGGDPADRERTVGFLPLEKQERVLELRERYAREEEEIYAGSRGVLLEQDRIRLGELAQDREAELALLLTPAELEGYQLRNSPLAARLREEAGGFKMGEEEFRALYKLQKTFEDQFESVFDRNDPAQMAIRERAEADARAALEAEIKTVLGDERYPDYVRGQDEDYQQLLRFTERLELSTDIAARVFEMKQEALVQKQRLESNPALTAEQRRRALAAIAAEVERSVSKEMGASMFEAYRNAGAGWINDLSEPDQVTAVGAQDVDLPPLPPLPPRP